MSGSANFAERGPSRGGSSVIAARLYLKRSKGLARLVQLGEAGEEPVDGVGGEAAEGRRLDLDSALRALSPAERLCVSLCCGAGLSHAEAAEALKTPLGTVKSHVRRGVEKMRAQLASDRPGSDAAMIDPTAPRLRTLRGGNV